MRKAASLDNTAAVIDIGPDFIKMKVSAMKGGKIEEIDKLEMPTNLGHEIFNNSKVSFECLRNISEILNGYFEILREYGVKKFKVITSTFFKEAQNYEYVVDQIKIRNNVDVEILEDGLEKSLIYSEIVKRIRLRDRNCKNILIAYVGASSVGLAIYSKDSVMFSQNVRIGSLKLHDILGNVQDQTSDFGTVLSEYIDRMLSRISLPLKKEEINGLIIAGSQIDLIERLCGNKIKSGESVIDSANLHDFYKSISKMTGELISEKYDISMQEADLFFTSMAIYHRVLLMTNLKNVTSLKIELWNGITAQMLCSKGEAFFERNIRKNSISSAKTVASHFKCDMMHMQAAYRYASLIFDKMEKVHGLDDKNKLFLELAIILHEVGYYVNSKYPRISTFDIIKNLEIYGLEQKDVSMIAHISKYDEFTVPSMINEEYKFLSTENKLAISKMVAIFRVANALDKSKKQKFKDIKVKLTDKNLIITTESDKNVYLEKWAFNKCVPFFEEVFGINPQLIVKTLLF